MIRPPPRSPLFPYPPLFRSPAASVKPAAPAGATANTSERAATTAFNQRNAIVVLNLAAQMRAATITRRAIAGQPALFSQRTADRAQARGADARPESMVRSCHFT